MVAITLDDESTDIWVSLAFKGIAKNRAPHLSGSMEDMQRMKVWKMLQDLSKLRKNDLVAMASKNNVKSPNAESLPFVSFGDEKNSLPNM